MIITPAILPSNFHELLHTLFLVEGVVDRVQIDICDGVFGLEKTWLPYKEKDLPHGFSYEFDCMVKDWRKYIARIVAIEGVDSVVAHIDEMSLEDLAELVAVVKPYGTYLGLSVSLSYDADTFIDRVRFVMSKYSKVYIQVMGIRHIGAQGQPFDPEALRRVEYLHHALRHFDIQVDGAMNNDTILRVLNRGATGAVVGSYIFKSRTTKEQIKKVIDELERSFGKR